MRQFKDPRKQSPAQSMVREYGRLVLTKPLEGLQAYAERMRLPDEPEVLAHQITTGALNVKEAFGMVGLSAAVAALVAQPLGIDLGGFKTGFGLLDKVLDGLLVMIVYLFTAALAHAPLRLAGGRATFRSTFVANTYFSAVFYPVLVAWIGVLKLLGESEEEAWRLALVGALPASAWVLGAVHTISWKRAVVALGIFQLALLLLIALIAVTIVNVFR